MLPSHASIFIAGLCDPALWSSRVTWWDSVYGFDMKRMKRHLFRDAYVETLPVESIVTSTSVVRRLNLLSMEASEQDILDSKFELEYKEGRSSDAVARETASSSPEQKGNESSSASMPTSSSSSSSSEPEGGRLLHGIALWFDVDFTDERYAGVAGKTQVLSKKAEEEDDDAPPLESAVETPAAASALSALSSPISSPPATATVHGCLSTSPFAPRTHWYQTLLLFDKPHQLTTGSTKVKGSISMSRDASHSRDYRFLVQLDGAGGRTTHSFLMS
jgi:hypothetical protein